MRFEDFLGEHLFSGIEIQEDDGTGARLLVTIDGRTFLFRENPDDGYRSFIEEEVEEINWRPRYNFNAVKCRVEWQPSPQNRVLMFIDSENEKCFLEVGTADYDDWYPIAVIHFKPENMSCNEERGEDRFV